MITKHIRTWKGFLKAIDEVRSIYSKTIKELDNGKRYERNNLILFRGQANTNWKLETTLERATKKQFHVFDYVFGAIQQSHEIEAFTERFIGDLWFIRTSFEQYVQILAKWYSEQF